MTKELAYRALLQKLHSRWAKADAKGDAELADQLMTRREHACGLLCAEQHRQKRIENEARYRNRIYSAPNNI